MITAKVGSKTYELILDDKKVLVDGVELFPNITSEDKRHSSVILDNKSYNTEIIALNPEEKKCVLKINGKVISVELADQYDALLKKLGIDVKSSAKISELKAPMPGLVLQIFVSEGDQIQKGDNLFVLEAMKMENIIKSPADLTIKQLKISVGDKVEKNQVLVVFS